MADRVLQPENTLNTRTLVSSGLSTTPEGQFTLAGRTAEITGENVSTLSAKIKALLGQYQQAGQVQESQGIQEQVRRGTAPLPADLAGAQLSPSQILGFRRGEVSAVEPTIGGARKQIQEAESAISQLRDFESTYSANKLRLLTMQQQQESQLRDDARALFNSAIGVGSKAVEGIIAKNPDIIKNAGFNKETADFFVQGLKEQEAIKAKQAEEVSMGKATLEALREQNLALLGQKLGVGTFSTPQNPAIGDAFNRATAGTTFTTDDRIQYQRQIQGYMDRGDIQGAKDFIEDLAVSGFGIVGYQTYITEKTGIAQLNDIKREMQNYIAKGGNTNIFVGKEQDILNKIGKTKDPDLARIGVKLTNALITFRRQATGVQFSQKEQEQYEKMFPKIGKDVNFNMANLDGLTQAMQIAMKATLQQRIGASNYSQLFEWEYIQ